MISNPFVVAAEVFVILVALVVALAVVAQRIFGTRGYSSDEIDQVTTEYRAEREAAEEAPEPEEVVS